MDRFRYKIFATADGAPLALMNEIIAAANLLQYFNRDDTGDQMPTAALKDQDSDCIL